MSDGTANCTLDSGDTAWVVSASILVLGMVPGLALFEGGLLRSKSTLSIYTQIMVGILILSVQWNVFGFSMTYGTSLKGIIGHPIAYPFFLNVREGNCLPQAPAIPGYVFAVFQMMFAAITPLLQTGAFAERMRFPAFLIYTVLWEILVYYPIAHWIWGGGWLSPQGNVFGGAGVIDFAGGITIHTSSGMSAFLVAWFIGRRKGFEKKNGYFRPSNLTTSLLGAVFLYLGWFGFNGGSALASSTVAANAVLNTQMGACICGVVWFVLHYAHHKKVSFVEILNGTVAGLAGITPCSGFINPEWAFFVSLILVVHGLTGAIGSLANGFFSSTDVNESGQDGWVGGRPIQIAYQLLGIGVCMAWSGLITLILYKLIDNTIGMRVTEQVENSGIGFHEHDEFLDDSHYYIHKQALLGRESVNSDAVRNSLIRDPDRLY